MGIRGCGKPLPGIQRVHYFLITRGAQTYCGVPNKLFNAYDAGVWLHYFSLCIHKSLQNWREEFLIISRRAARALNIEAEYVQMPVAPIVEPERV